MTETVTQPTATMEPLPTEGEATPAETAESEPVEALAAPEPEPTEPERSATYAVIATGGKQYRVKVGDRIVVERLAHEPGSDIELERVLLVGGDGATRVGTPVVEGVSVAARVDDHFRGEKIVVFKFKPKKRYRRRTGHRQSQTHLTITGISG